MDFFIKAIIERLATDVHDEKTIVEHADSIGLPSKATESGLLRVAEAFDYASSGYDDVRAFLAHQSTVLGTPHLEIIRILRNHVATQEILSSQQ